MTKDGGCVFCGRCDRQEAVLLQYGKNIGRKIKTTKFLGYSWLSGSPAYEAPICEGCFSIKIEPIGVYNLALRPAPEVIADLIASVEAAIKTNSTPEAMPITRYQALAMEIE